MRFPDERRRGLARTVGVILVAAFVCAAIVYAVLQPAEGWPDDARRIRHPRGFSIGLPKSWEHKMIWGNADARTPDMLLTLPTVSVGNPGKLEVSKLHTPVDGASLTARGYTAFQFQGKPAWQSTTDFKKTKDHARNIIFERDGQWYELLVLRPVGESLVDGVWQAYLESFRTEPVVDGPTLTLPTTQTFPATGPA